MKLPNIDERNHQGKKIVLAHKMKKKLITLEHLCYLKQSIDCIQSLTIHHDIFTKSEK